MVVLSTSLWQPPPLFGNELGSGTVAVFFMTGMISAFPFWYRVQTQKGLDLRQLGLSRLFGIDPLQHGAEPFHRSWMLGTLTDTAPGSPA